MPGCGCGCCGQAAWAVAVLLAAVLAHACYNAAARVEADVSYEPFPSPEALAEQTSGRYFRARPSDGGSLEYYEYGSQAAGARAWLLVHGAASTGGMLNIFPDFDARMQALNVRVVAPTMPGWGASDAYGPVFETTGAQWLARWAQDSMALMDHLGVGRFAVSGLSLGGAPGLATAAVRMRQLPPCAARSQTRACL